ncbi:MAG: MCE family protein [Candidatus Delongbacteria bacterium]|nr:MCE family protein [Candidatus Delongbacteria bacterium]
MVTRAQKIRVMTLIMITFMIFMYVMFLLVGNKLMSRNDIYYIKLEKQSVSGLNVGTDVKFYGINIGKVVDIIVNPENISEIIVTVSIKENTPIKETSEANLSYQSIATGLKQIEITGGENDDRTLDPGEFIRSGSDIFDDITGKAEIIAQKIETLLNNMIHVTSRENTAKFIRLIDQLEEDTRKLDTLIVEAKDFFVTNKKDISVLIKKSNMMVDNISRASVSAEKALNSIDAKINSEEFSDIVRNFAEISEKINKQELEELVASANSLMKKSDHTINLLESTFIQGRSNLLRSIELFKETLENINEFAILIRDNPDILIRGKESE